MTINKDWEKRRQIAAEFEWKNRDNDTGNVLIQVTNYAEYSKKPKFGVSHSSGPGNANVYSKSNLKKFINKLLKAQALADNLNK